MHDSSFLKGCGHGDLARQTLQHFRLENCSVPGKRLQLPSERRPARQACTSLCNSSGPNHPHRHPVKCRCGSSQALASRLHTSQEISNLQLSVGRVCPMRRCDHHFRLPAAATLKGLSPGRVRETEARSAETTRWWAFLVADNSDEPRAQSDRMSLANGSSKWQNRARAERSTQFARCGELPRAITFRCASRLSGGSC